MNTGWRLTGWRDSIVARALAALPECMDLNIYPQGGSQHSVTSVPWDPTTSSGHKTCAHST